MCPDLRIPASRHLATDQELNAEQLRAKYDRLAKGSKWGEHPGYPMERWCAEVAGKNTRLGYWDWVVSQLKLTYDESGDGAVLVDAEEEEIAQLYAADTGNQGA